MLEGAPPRPSYTALHSREADTAIVSFVGVKQMPCLPELSIYRPNTCQLKLVAGTRKRDLKAN